MPSSSPKKMAIQLSQMLTAVLGEDRYPLDVESLIYEYSKNFPDPVTKIRKVALDGFEGMLRPSSRKQEWHILYNESPAYVGRERFTLAHEFAHYLLDRTPLGKNIKTDSERVNLEFHCNPLGQELWDQEEQQREKNADTFASYLLMPISDFRLQAADQTIDLELFKHIANRYGVSLTAAILKWIEFTDQLAVVIVSRDGFALWGRASSNALKKSIFIRTGMEIPAKSHSQLNNGTEGKILHVDPKTWPISNKAKATHEMSVYSSRIDKTITIVLFEDSGWLDFKDEETTDSFDKFMRLN